MDSCVVKDGFAFIEFTESEFADDAIANMDGKDLDGRFLRVEKTRVEAMGRVRNNEGSDRYETNNIFVANIPENTTEDELRKVFESYGKSTFYI